MELHLETGQSYTAWCWQFNPVTKYKNMFSWDTVRLINILNGYKYKLDFLYQANSDMYHYGCVSLNALKLLMRMYNLMQCNM